MHVHGHTESSIFNLPNVKRRTTYLYGAVASFDPYLGMRSRSETEFAIFPRFPCRRIVATSIHVGRCSSIIIGDSGSIGISSLTPHQIVIKLAKARLTALRMNSMTFQTRPKTSELSLSLVFVTHRDLAAQDVAPVDHSRDSISSLFLLYL